MARRARGRGSWCWAFVGQGRRVVDALCYGALEALELGLLVAWEARGRGACLEGGGVRARGWEEGGALEGGAPEGGAWEEAEGWHY